MHGGLESNSYRYLTPVGVNMTSSQLGGPIRMSFQHRKF
jgi:hypothetical protein